MLYSQTANSKTLMNQAQDQESIGDMFSRFSNAKLLDILSKFETGNGVEMNGFAKRHDSNGDANLNELIEQFQTGAPSVGLGAFRVF